MSQREAAARLRAAALQWLRREPLVRNNAGAAARVPAAERLWLATGSAASPCASFLLPVEWPQGSTRTSSASTTMPCSTQTRRHAAAVPGSGE